MSRQSILRNATGPGRVGTPANMRNAAAIIPSGGAFYNGVRDPTGKISEYSVSK